MAQYDIKVTVTYNYSVEADSRDEAEAEGWKYENYAHHAEVDTISVYENDDEEWIEDEDEDE
jgi:hypothetical protein